MLTCKQACFLASKKLNAKLTLKELVGFYIHIALCSFCRHYVKEMEALHKLMSKVANSEDMGLLKNATLSEQSCERIQQEINQRLSKTNQ